MSVFWDPVLSWKRTVYKEGGCLSNNTLGLPPFCLRFFSGLHSVEQGLINSHCSLCGMTVWHDQCDRCGRCDQCDQCDKLTLLLVWQSVTRENSSGQFAPPSLYACGGNYDEDEDDEDYDYDNDYDDYDYDYDDADDLAARECWVEYPPLRPAPSARDISKSKFAPPVTCKWEIQNNNCVVVNSKLRAHLFFRSSSSSFSGSI